MYEGDPLIVVERLFRVDELAASVHSQLVDFWLEADRESVEYSLELVKGKSRTHSVSWATVDERGLSPENLKTVLTFFLGRVELAIVAVPSSWPGSTCSLTIE